MLDWSVLEVGPRICSVLATLISRGKRNQVWLLYKHVLFVPTDMQNVPLFSGELVSRKMRVSVQHHQ